MTREDFLSKLNNLAHEYDPLQKNLGLHVGLISETPEEFDWFEWNGKQIVPSEPVFGADELIETLVTVHDDQFEEGDSCGVLPRSDDNTNGTETVYG